MKRKIAFLFSGQGSQYYQMGRALYEQNSRFRMNMERMDRLARQQLGASVIDALYGPNSKAEPFSDIRLTHPAIFMVEFALAQTVIELGVEPVCTLGASLGTFAALAVAGCWPMEEALAAVIRQALVIERHCPLGGMIAVLGNPTLYEESPFLRARSVIGGRHFASHFVLSAPQDNLEAIKRFLGHAGVPFQPLTVRYPFHAPWVEPMRDALIEAGDVARLRLCGIPVFCSAKGGILDKIADGYFWDVVRKEIAFMRVISEMEMSGPFDYVDLSPSGTLGTFLKYLLPKQANSRNFSVMTPFEKDAELLTSVVAQLRSNIETWVKA